jgi:hypothetical protein
MVDRVDIAGCGRYRDSDMLRTAAARCPSKDLQIRRFLYLQPASFRSVRDLGLVSPSCPHESESSQDCSSVWLPAWLPRPNRAARDPLLRRPVCAAGQPARPQVRRSIDCPGVTASTRCRPPDRARDGHVLAARNIRSAGVGRSCRTVRRGLCPGPGIPQLCIRGSVVHRHGSSRGGTARTSTACPSGRLGFLIAWCRLSGNSGWR